MGRFRIGMAALSLASVAAAGTAQQQDHDAPKEKMVCKRQEVTGSLVATRKECRSRADWNRLAQNQRATAERLVESNRPGFGVGK